MKSIYSIRKRTLVNEKCHLSAQESLPGMNPCPDDLLDRVDVATVGAIGAGGREGGRTCVSIGAGGGGTKGPEATDTAGGGTLEY